VWQPLLDWLRQRHAVSLAVTTGLSPASQPVAAIEQMQRVVGSYDVMRLTAIQAAAGSAGSLVIALALAEGRVTADSAWRAALLDELYQAERWGEIEEAVARRQAIRAEIAAAARFLALLGDG
jgi:chaperone required for assembly of F1-ATPase